LDLSALSIDCLNKVKNFVIDTEYIQLNYSFRNLIKMSFGRLDLDIREQLRGRCISAGLNIFGGFDTESQNIDVGQMELLTLQTAVTGCLDITIPKIQRYTPKGINPHDGEVYNKTK
jgi:hypothetical protein